MSLVASRALLGQWFTPAPVADLAIALAVGGGIAAGHGRGSAPEQIIDPTCGDGIFLERALRAGIAADRLHGVELDPAAAAVARARVPKANVVCGDLFDLEPPRQGFAAVVGNPPYVRQERLSAQRKRAIRDRLAADYPDAAESLLDRMVGRGDLAAACIARCVRLVRPGGRVALIVSSALVDAGYARPLWELIARDASVVALVEAPRERWFADAAVNAMILVIERGRIVRPVTIARLDTSTDDAARRVHCLDDLADVAELRTAPTHDLSRWAACLRAPAIWFEVERQARDALVPLSSIAQVRRGITSGANDVFYLTRDEAVAAAVEPELCVPLVRSPREVGAGSIAIDPDATAHVAIVCPPDKLGRYPGARRWFESRAAVADRPTLRARPEWWALPVRPARLFLTKAYASRFVQRFSPRDVVGDQRVYSIHPAQGIDPAVLAAVLNATSTALALESLGRSSLGEGALEWTVADAASLPIIDPRSVDHAGVTAALRDMCRRPIRAVAGESELSDRRALDVAVAPTLAALLPAMHRALIDSCARRQARSANRLVSI